MTATTSFSRALSRQLLPGGPRPFTRPHSTLLRVSCNCTSKNARPFSLRHRANLSAAFEHARKYATAVEKKAPAKPKTRAAAPKKRTTTKAKAKKTAAKKPKKKVVKKVKPKVKKVAPEVALRRKERLANSELRAAALLTRPKQLPSTAYLVLVSQISTKGAQLQQIIQSASEKYKTLSPEERESLNQTANANKAKNEIEYKKWVESHDPLTIKKANNARNKLRKQAKAAGKAKVYSHIQDDRLVKPPVNAYNFFFRERVASGDLKGLSLAEGGILVGKEWKALSAGEKERYKGLESADKDRYIEEHKSVYGIDAPFLRASKA
ncbi:hypothetical protein B0A52_08474 [Exophiala mesophila]|uniref:HMG box domain-containing protein n=1 Tax=Exophiala mesophila TaxID=212818 RepID=A0A438MXM0_EXOME|nr:hypothetical protein B0A52_08474 [Exophiala mesophila]